jgi:Uma2 family endonuclease
MTEVLDPIEQAPLVIHPIPSHRMDDDEFFEFCQLNRDLRIERNAEGDIILMAPAGGSSGRSNAALTAQFWNWANKDGSGTIFDSSTGFVLPNQAVRAPDVSWVLNKRLDQLTDEQWKKFLPLCPDFALELRSESDPLHIQQAKMAEYIANGSRLGWLIDPVRKQAHIYRPGQPIEILDRPNQISGEPILRGFTLDLTDIWSGKPRRR